MRCHSGECKARTSVSELVLVSVLPTESVVVTTATALVERLVTDDAAIWVVVLKLVLPAESVFVRTKTAPAPPGALVTVLVKTDPPESVPVVVVTLAAPLPKPVLAAPRSALTALSRLCRFDWYALGTLDRKAGGVAAVRAESTMLLMSPVTLAADAADCTATAKETTWLDGM